MGKRVEVLKKEREKEDPREGYVKYWSMCRMEKALLRTH